MQQTSQRQYEAPSNRSNYDAEKAYAPPPGAPHDDTGYSNAPKYSSPQSAGQYGNQSGSQRIGGQSATEYNTAQNALQHNAVTQGRRY